MKKRILFCNEASYVSTGFANYNRELLTRLHATGEFEIAEHSNEAIDGDARNDSFPWKIYPNRPATNSPEEAEYRSHPLNTFGRWRYEKVCCDFKPNIVQSITDPWMNYHLATSPFRRLYNLVYMPTVDGYPQSAEWISQYKMANGIFTYTDWAVDVLKTQCPQLPVVDSATMGIHHDIFKPVPNKEKHRADLQFKPDIFIIGTIMRNQKRKLYPDLFKAFRKFLDTAPPSMARKTYLYVHTAYPDMGWDIPTLLQEEKLGSRVLFTYLCHRCQALYPAFFSGGAMPCRNCGQLSATMPHPGKGGAYNILPNIYNLFDVYVQLSMCEGLGIPVVEATACGVPAMVVDYSGMKDFINKLDATPIPVQRFIRESETHRYFALPDLDQLVQLWIDFFSEPAPVRARLSKKARDLTVQHYNWDDIAQKWINYFRAAPVDYQAWSRPPHVHRPNMNVPAGLSNSQFVSWGFANIAGRPDLTHSWDAVRMLKNLNIGARPQVSYGEHTHQQPNEIYDVNNAVRELEQICQFNNYWEQMRVK